jgi:hypothetical protein
MPNGLLTRAGGVVTLTYRTAVQYIELLNRFSIARRNEPSGAAPMQAAAPGTQMNFASREGPVALPQGFLAFLNKLHAEYTPQRQAPALQLFDLRT